MFPCVWWWAGQRMLPGHEAVARGVLKGFLALSTTHGLPVRAGRSGKTKTKRKKKIKIKQNVLL